MFRVDRETVGQGCQGLCGGGEGDPLSAHGSSFGLSDVTNDMDLDTREEPIVWISSIAGLRPPQVSRVAPRIDRVMRVRDDRETSSSEF